MNEKELYIRQINIRDARDSLKIAGEITGLGFDESADQYAIERVVEEGLHWSLKSLREMLSLLKSEDFSFVPLVKCVPNVTNEDLLRFCTVFRFWSTRMMIFIAYSGYDLNDWIDLYNSLRQNCRSASFILHTIANNVYLYHSNKSRDERRRERFVTERFCEFARMLPDINDLLNMSFLISFGGYIGRFSLSELRKNCWNICEQETGMSIKMIKELRKRCIPCFFNYGSYVGFLHIIGINPVNSFIFECIERAENISELYQFVFEDWEEVLYRHRMAFEAFAQLLFNPYIIGALKMEVEELLERFNDYTFDLYERSHEKISSLLETCTQKVISAKDVESAREQLYSLFTAMEIVGEALPAMLDDPATSRFLLKDPHNLWGINKLAIRIADMLKEVGALAAFPEDLIVAAIKGMHARDAYSQIITRGCIPF
jgi:hypothetical protein